MKIKLTSILFLFVIVAPAMATFFWIKYQESVVRHGVVVKRMGGIDKSELILLKFTKAEAKQKLNWEHSQEFEYNSSIYDVVETQSSGDSIFYLCWPDIKETALENKFTALVNEALGSTPFQKEEQEQIISYFKTLYCTQHNAWGIFPLETMHTHLLSTHFNFCSLYLFPPFTPPPELV